MKLSSSAALRFKIMGKKMAPVIACEAQEGIKRKKRSKRFLRSAGACYDISYSFLLRLLKDSLGLVLMSHFTYARLLLHIGLAGQKNF